MTLAKLYNDSGSVLLKFTQWEWFIQTYSQCSLLGEKEGKCTKFAENIFFCSMDPVCLTQTGGFS